MRARQSHCTYRRQFKRARQIFTTKFEYSHKSRNGRHKIPKIYTAYCHEYVYNTPPTRKIVERVTLESGNGGLEAAFLLLSRQNHTAEEAPSTKGKYAWQRIPLRCVLTTKINPISIRHSNDPRSQFNLRLNHERMDCNKKHLLQTVHKTTTRAKGNRAYRALTCKCVYCFNTLGCEWWENFWALFVYVGTST